MDKNSKAESKEGIKSQRDKRVRQEKRKLLKKESGRREKEE